MKIGIYTIIASSVLLAFAMTREPTVTPETRAKNLCRGEVNKRLKDPEHAKFGRSKVDPNPAGGWIVYREVSARNSFGQMVRATFVCDVSADFSRVSTQQ